MLITKTPDNIGDINLNDVVKLVPRGNEVMVPPPANRMKVIRIIFQVLGYDLSSDLALALCAEPTAKLVIATAGGGKTTGAQINAICEKIWRNSRHNPTKKINGDKILCLVYNKHNVKPMEDKHRMLVNRLRMSNISGLHIDDEINAATMHSFCDQLRKENVAKLGLIGFHLLSDNEAIMLMQKVKDRVIAKYRLRFNPSDKDLLSLYTYAKESMLSVSELEDTDKFQDIHLDVEQLQEIFDLYERMKVVKRRYDFTDMLTKIYELFKTDKAALANTQRYYEYVIADEIQDFTPIMMNLLQLMVSNGTPLMCIGDEDQGIYNFRGADIYNTLDFANKFEGGEVYSLTRNRRCGEVILNYAKSVITENKTRYHKVIQGVRPGGAIQLLPYTSLEGEHLKLVSLLEKLSEDDLYDSVVCYRERYSSLMLTEMLAEKNIPHYVISGYTAYSHPLYSDIISVLNALEAPKDKLTCLALYKVLPVKKDKIRAVFGYDSVNRRFKDDTKQHFSLYDYGEAMSINGFSTTMETLKELSIKIQSSPMDEIFPTVFQLLKRYHWNYLRKDREKLNTYDDFMEMRVDKVFNQHKTYKQIFEALTMKMDTCRRNNTSKEGVAISTFHGLKGLEFKNCYLMDLDNNTFPNFSLIDSKTYNESAKIALKECETRLYYVAITRAKDNLILLYNEENPSRYVMPLIRPGKYSNIFADETITSEVDNIQKSETASENVDTEMIGNSALITTDYDDDLMDLFDEEVIVAVENTISENSYFDDDALLDLLDDDIKIINNSSETYSSSSNNVSTDLRNMDIDALPIENKFNIKENSYLSSLISNLGG